MALFPRWSNSIVYALIVSGVFVLVGVPLFLLAWVRTPYNTGQYEPLSQPVIFDHRHHINDDAIDCRYCHFPVEKAAYAGVPPVSLCMNCHSQIWNTAVVLEPVRDCYFGASTLAWNRVNAVPEFVYFNHEVHVRRGVGCVTCHGRVDQMAAVFRAAPLVMSWCLTCHRNPEPNLRPLDRITDMVWQPEDQAKTGAAIALALKIQPPTNCTGCHR